MTLAGPPDLATLDVLARETTHGLHSRGLKWKPGDKFRCAANTHAPEAPEVRWGTSWTSTGGGHARCPPSGRNGPPLLESETADEPGVPPHATDPQVQPDGPRYPALRGRGFEIHPGPCSETLCAGPPPSPESLATETDTWGELGAVVRANLQRNESLTT
jgi:hypothetical protein